MKNKYFEANNTDAFEKRTEQASPVIRSPWIYTNMKTLVKLSVKSIYEFKV